MKCSELYRILMKDGWYPVSQKEIGKGLVRKIKKDAGLKDS